jgi:hypothetical protein
MSAATLCTPLTASDAFSPCRSRLSPGPGALLYAEEEGAMNADLIARLNVEYPASRHSTAWAPDESGVPTRRVGWNVGDEETPASPIS